MPTRSRTGWCLELYKRQPKQTRFAETDRSPHFPSSDLLAVSLQSRCWPWKPVNRGNWPSSYFVNTFFLETTTICKRNKLTGMVYFANQKKFGRLRDRSFGENENVASRTGNYICVRASYFSDIEFIMRHEPDWNFRVQETRSFIPAYPVNADTH